MNTPTDLRALFFATAPYGDVSILAPIVRMLRATRTQWFLDTHQPTHPKDHQ